ncbi:hypothetical protein LCGC14_1773000 [marine sediment metagenome]|uniref:Uncharacterized protein n=1 Tax=marine sediment metagenome TaxID=412755 RepID=A0A0F9GXR0_9ZZZZ
MCKDKGSYSETIEGASGRPPDLMGLLPNFADSFASRLRHVRFGKADAMSQLVRLTNEEMALEHILKS